MKGRTAEICNLCQGYLKHTHLSKVVEESRPFTSELLKESRARLRFRVRSGERPGSTFQPGTARCQAKFTACWSTAPKPNFSACVQLVKGRLFQGSSSHERRVRPTSRQISHHRHVQSHRQQLLAFRMKSPLRAWITALQSFCQWHHLKHQFGLDFKCLVAFGNQINECDSENPFML